MKGSRLLIVLLLLLTGQFGFAQVGGLDTIQIPGERTCGPTGSAQSAANAALDRLKNRWHLPQATDFDPGVTLHKMLEPGDDTNRWNSGKAAEVTGFVVGVQKGGVETCNCKTHQIDYMDTHITLAETDNPTTQNQQVIVEVTPRLRIEMKPNGLDWRTDALAQQILGHWVRVRGWLLFDDYHKDQSENTNPGNPGNWRATAWEMHPVTSLQIVAAPGGPGPAIHGAQPRVDLRALPTRRHWTRRFNLRRHQHWVQYPGRPRRALRQEVDE